MTTGPAADVARTLCDSAQREAPSRVTEAPAAPGLYSWWSSEPELLGIRGTPQGRAYLYYVGKAEDSLRSRLTTHAHRTTRSSTERFTWAALGFREFGWIPGQKRGGKTTREVLIRDVDEAALTAWIEVHLEVSWCEHPEPGAVEADVIGLLKPPLNLDENVGHPEYAKVKAARAEFRRVARGGD